MAFGPAPVERVKGVLGDLVAHPNRRPVGAVAARLDAVPRCGRPFAAHFDPLGDEVMVDARQHEQGGREPVVTGFDPSRPRAGHDAGLFGKKVITTARECLQLGHGIIDVSARPSQPQRRPRQPRTQDAVSVGLAATGGPCPVSNICSMNARPAFTNVGLRVRELSFPFIRLAWGFQSFAGLLIG